MNCQALNELDGLQFVPVNAMKQPIVKGWQTSLEKHDLSNVAGVGLVCGSPSGNVECIDIDLKYSLDPKLFDKYKKLVHEAAPDLLNKLVVQKTRSNGFHLIYRCSEIAGNLKLANRPTTKDEKAETYKKTYDAEILKSTEDDKAKKIAEKSAANDKVRVLFETRGIGGQFVCHPSEGYQLVFGDLQSISEIKPEEREVLLSCARHFNEIYEPVILPKNIMPKTKGKSSFEAYNESGDVVGLLQSNGWTVVGQKGKKTVFLRPGSTSSATSGNFDHEKNWFSVFTTSTEFEPERAYLPYAVYAILECSGDYSLASKKLYESGYGERQEALTKEKAPSTRVIQSRVDPEKEDFSLFATTEDYDSYLQAVRDGTLKMGLTTGSPALDAHFVLKEGAFVHINGIDNVGKSEIIWWMLLLAAMYHGWKGVIFSSENTLGAFMRRMIQFYWGKPLSGSNVMSQSEYEIAKKFIEKHFLLIKSQEDLYNYKDIINLAKIAQKKGDYQYGMIDPYNSLKIDLSGYSKLNTHEYHYEALSELKSYGQKNKFGWFITHHAVTAALRLKDADKKYPVAPRKEDTEQGGKVANKADDFLTIHRITQHPTDWMISEIHVRKIKDTETGGRPTILELPIRFERYKGGYAYVEVDEFRVRGVDPVEEWHKRNGTAQELNYYVEPKQTWQPFKSDDKLDIDF